MTIEDVKLFIQESIGEEEDKIKSDRMFMGRMYDRNSFAAGFSNGLIEGLQNILEFLEEE